MTFFGVPSSPLNTRRTKVLPIEPVPPVTRIFLPLNVIVEYLSWPGGCTRSPHGVYAGEVNQQLRGQPYDGPLVKAHQKQRAEYHDGRIQPALPPEAQHGIAEQHEHPDEP